MFQRNLLSFATALALASFARLEAAQPPTEPTAYTVVTEFRVTGAVIRTTSRLGAKVRVDVGDAGNASARPTRTLYDLQTMQSMSWVPSDASVPCTRAGFAPGAWLDPFDGAADLAMKDVRQTGAESIHGVPTVILESDTKPGFRLWVDPKTGLMWKSEFSSKKLGTKITYFEVTDVSLAPPPAATFDAPPSCTRAN